ncbi:MAG TPA: glycosyltransferase family 29 protein [Devosiaceae bacterium]
MFRTIVWRYRYPELYDDSEAHRRIEDLARDLSGRRIAVVGNAQSLFDFQDGSVIDGHDVVVRLNRGVVFQPKSQGQRTDMVGISCPMSWKEVQEGFGTPKLIWLSPIRELMAADLVRKRMEMAWVPFDTWRELKGQLGQGRPSSGLIILYALKMAFEPSAISLFGFDWKASRTSYHDNAQHVREMSKTWHNWDVERRIVQSWTRGEPVIRIYPLEKHFAASGLVQ